MWSGNQPKGKQHIVAGGALWLMAAWAAISLGRTAEMTAGDLGHRYGWDWWIQFSGWGGMIGFWFAVAILVTLTRWRTPPPRRHGIGAIIALSGIATLMAGATTLAIALSDLRPLWWLVFAIGALVVFVWTASLAYLLVEAPPEKTHPGNPT